MGTEQYMHGTIGESNSTKQISSLVKYIYSQTPVKDSLFEHAAIYFASAEQNKIKKATLTTQLQATEQGVNQASVKDKAKLETALIRAQSNLKAEDMRQKKLRLARRDKVVEVCTRLVQTAEGEDWQEAQTNSGKFLATLFLLSPRGGKKLADLHQRLKPAYKAVLALRLLDKLILDAKITYPFIVKHHDAENRYSEKSAELSYFQQEVCLPIVITAIFQDIGLQHPDAQQLLKGEDGKQDEFRLLEKDTRIKLLKLNHKHTLDYLENGLGAGQYAGNSKADRAEFNKNEQAKLKFIRTLVIDALKPKLDVGNIIKIPQIYSSIIFSTKTNAAYSDMPKAGKVIEKAAENGAVNKVMADHFIQIVGHFPQGYGITYIPQDENKYWLDRYEYAIVIHLNPHHPDEPICRGATRKLTFHSAGQSFTVNKESNLHFNIARKKLSTVAPERLKEILEKLCSNFEERKNLALIPHHWIAYDYFTFVKFQNLWKKT
ncbi:hypothetical protein L0668_10610 [Paraglaciecola aquimarina]|uniref:Toxin n=1 Tax=Paraglaciecola algarum TaxID=3050085 RepID=A0ABS9D7A2_9ALTE|nr:hypothetical protein [Paraglaciecola sp. G1-23]MCF2948559.1 hypothetical protein [Paraglaciecola sp. G1-23]